MLKIVSSVFLCKKAVTNLQNRILFLLQTEAKENFALLFRFDLDQVKHY